MTAVLWGSELSPFFLKIEALCRHAGLPLVRRPDGGSLRENLRLMLRLKRAQSRREVRRWPSADPLDEYSLVPYLLTADGAVHYDSSGIAGWLDHTRPGAAGALVPDDDPLLAFVCRLLDEALDEVGLYCVHHHRWVVSHYDNDAGARLAQEYRSLVPAPLRPLMAAWFSRRQIRRLPYLFSVAAPSASSAWAMRPPPPGRDGFPLTQARLGQAWDELVDAASHALQRRPYLLGARFTLADAALYGQLGMNLSDPSSERRLRERSPRLRAWLQDIADGRHVGTRGALGLDPDLEPLLAWVTRHFMPLMQANAQAYAHLQAQGQRCWNEAAFNRGTALYQLDWCCAPARSVVKTFQVRIWRDLCAQARALPSAAMAELPLLSAFTRDG